jgi:hypothetical protein
MYTDAVPQSSDRAFATVLDPFRRIHCHAEKERLWIEPTAIIQRVYIARRKETPLVAGSGTRTATLVMLM